MFINRLVRRALHWRVMPNTLRALGLVLSASLIYPNLASAQGIVTPPLFFADHEGADCELDTLFTEWKNRRTGGLSSDLHAHVFASRNIAHSGGCAIGIRMTGLTTPNHPRAGAFVYLSNLKYPRHNAPAVFLPNGYYSAWYYIPKEYRAEHMWNVFQFMNRLRYDDVDGDPIAPFVSQSGTVERMFSVQIMLEDQPDILIKHVNYLTNPRQAAARQLGLKEAENLSCFDLNNNCYPTPPSGQIKAATRWLPLISEVSLPVDRWFQIEGMIKQSTNTADGQNVNRDGRIKIWIDGQKIVDEQNIQTKLHPDATLHWEVNSYSNYGVMSHDTVDLYLDDGVVRPFDPGIPDEDAKSSAKDCSIGQSVLAQEAERGSISGAFRVRQQQNASDGAVLYILENQDGSETPPSDATYCFHVTEDGNYILRGLPDTNRLKAFINGSQVSGPMYLNAGRQTLRLTHQWGDATVDMIRLQPEADQPGPQSTILSDFEDRSIWPAYQHSGNRAEARLVNEPLNGRDPNMVQEISLDARAAGIAMVFTNNLAARAWNNFDALEFELKSAAIGQRLFVTIRDELEIFETNIVTSAAGWQTISVPFSRFTRAVWQPAGAPDNGFERLNVERIMLQARTGLSNFSIDNVRVTKF